ncbi:MAG: leucine-rich repeat protein, partial [Oscillospiraceae bacterium]|nr:leucine-rich repeat protein [Oscillospiraceae bacterium]
ENCRLDSYSTGITVALEADIDLTGLDFSGIPIFSGSFNGNGHTISGLYVDGTGTHIGLFGYVKNYQKNIENLGIVDSYFAGDRFVGTISGYNYGGKIYNCYSLNCVVKGDKYVAGITSYAGENVVNCYSNATITGSQYVAGISYQLSMYDMENCLFVGSITAEKNVRALSDSGAYIANSYYLDTCGAEGTGRDGDLPVTAAQLASGEIAYELGSAYGQNIDNGQPRQAYPVLGGAKVLAIMGCDQVNLSGYTNIAGQQSGHSGDYGTNGICPRCGVYETPELVDDYYRITNAGNLYWFADKVNKGGEAERTLNAILVNDIDLEGKPDGSGRSWTPIGTSGGTNSQSFRGTFDGNGKTITGLYVDVQQNALGLFGEVRNGVVKNFTIYGDVKLNSKRDYIGGVIGSACGSDAESGSVISGITSYVNVTLGGNAHGSNRVAGLIGYVNHNTLVENCIWYGTLDLDIYRAQDGVGGLIGNANAQYTGTIRNCAAYGTIRTAYKSGSYVNPSDSTPFTTIYIGGILSNSIPNAASLIENCIWGGTIINETDLGEHAHISAVGTMNGFAGITNCFVLDNTLYITTNGAQDDKITVITQEQLLSGEVAFTLSNTENGSHWGQTLDGVSLPVPEGEKVYYGYLTCTDTQKEYANDSAVDEAKDNHSQEPTYQDNDDGTHTQHYDCCDAEFVMFHSYENNNCVCGAFGGHWGDCQWTLKNNVLTICGIGEIPAPTDWNPYPWGSYSEDITTIIISEGITHISDSAFVGFTALTYVSLPDSLLTMGDGVFSIASSLETIQLPPNMKHIADSTFSTSGLKSITIPEGVESIGDSAFANCTSLTEIILPQTLKHLERNVFGWSTGLKTIEIPASVTTIAAEVFQGTGTKVTVAEDNPYFSSDADGLLYNKDKTVLLHCPVKATEYTIPSTVKEIAASACVDLLVEHLTIPEGVQTIGENAFWLASMKSVNIPTTAESLATNAFLSCNSLEDVYVVCTWNDEAPLYTFNSSNITIHKTLHANYDENNFCVLCGGPRYDSAAMITKNGVNVMAYESLADAFAAVSGATAAEQVTVTLLKNTDLTTPVAAPASGVFVLDLNGFDANIDAKQLTVIDSSATESTAGTGSLITTGTVPLDQTVNGMRYITLENEGVYTFHRLTLYLQKMVLRTSSAGLYFTSYLACDQDLRLAISGFGIAVSTQHMPGKDFATDEAVRYVHYDGLPAIGSQQTHSCLVANIFQEGLSDNAERGKEKIYTNAYIVLDDGTVITAYDNTREVMARSLYDILFVLNEQYPNLDSTTQGTLNTFVSKWEDVITAYGLTNLLPEEQPA